MTRCDDAVPALPENDAIAPFTTPGTRLVWADLDGWLAAARQVLERRCSAKTYRDQAAHIQELARHTSFVEAHEREQLLELRAFLDKWYRPMRGGRAGTCYERLVNTIHNQLARLARTDDDDQAPPAGPQLWLPFDTSRRAANVAVLFAR